MALYSPTGYVARFIGADETLPVVKFTEGGVAMVCNTAGELVTVIAHRRSVGAVRLAVVPLDTRE
jgi:hypothetical protein